MKKNENAKFLGYWGWFFVGSGDKPGYRRLINRWFIFHIFIGAIISLAATITLKQAAKTVLLPLVGILIGLSFAWAGNANALMESSEIQKISKYHKGGFVEYVYTYQTAILAIMITLILWGIAGLEIFDEFWPTTKRVICYFTIKTILFCFSSLTLRECWHVILGTQWMLLVKKEIKNSTGEKE